MRPVLLLLPLLPSLLGAAERMERAEQPDEVGLVTISRGYLPGAGEVYRPPNHGFENRKLEGGNGWTLWAWDHVTDDPAGAPEGKRYFRAQPGAKVRLVLDGIPARGTRPLVISLWLRTKEDGIRGFFSAVTEATRFGTHTNLVLPNTGGEWRRVGFYVRPAPGATSARFMLDFGRSPEIGVDDLRVRTVTEEEFSTAWRGWRATYPDRDLTPGATDGRHLPLFLRKALEPPYVEGEPLRVMGIGSSYTNMLGNGERLIQHLRGLGSTRTIEYTKHVGSAVNFDFTKGWIQQHVVERQPDLLILYSGGDAPDLDALLRAFRARSTADVIVASLHLREQDKVVTPATIETTPWDGIREVCAKHGVEFVESRREWAAYLRDHEQPIPWLLKDAVHQNDHGALVINENIVRHLAEHPVPSYDPEERERFIPAAEVRDLTLGFHGNRIDLLGERSRRGASYEVLIDGVPAADFPAYHQTLIVPGATNHKPARGMTADRAPHLVTLGENLVPQEWTIRMTSDTGDYELTGSITGPDGSGNNGADFTSNSGQITIPTALWRRRIDKDGTYSNRAGDAFTFNVYRATTPVVDFKGEGRFRISLVQNADNAPHRIQLVMKRKGETRLHGFQAFQPPLYPGKLH